MRYDELKTKVNTGDLILFEGEYSISKTIERLEGCPYSHVGMVIRVEGFEDPLFFEATTLTNLEDQVTDNPNKTLAGPKIVNLYERLKHYGEDVKPYVPPKFAYRPLHVDRAGMTDALLVLHKSYYGIADPKEIQMIWEVILGRWFRIKAKKNNFFCSEWIALAYQALGLINTKYPYNSYMPKDFTSMSSFLKLQKGSFEKEIPMQV
ncbi:hypothetical protein [Desulfosporosinus sp. OT]|uniref:hypothetical protein n=1 Tax=Desulfosporosinus sp. OT TaxID=913865 RepID=UPI000223A4C4|nr:hypothetical protein [Desulfosporosinus sp. OT]EGW37142.1 hypothetical protein DOT_4954 [Desulfosporosinus sp. OT]